MKKILITLYVAFALMSALPLVASAQSSQSCGGLSCPTGTSCSTTSSGLFFCQANTVQTTPAPASVTVNSPYCTSCNLGYTPLEPIPGVTTNSSGTTLTFPQLLANIYYIAIVIGALFSVLMLTISGIRYMTSEVLTDKDKAKKRISACLWGLLLIATSWLILHTINPQLVTFNLNPCPQNNCTVSGTNMSGTSNSAAAGPACGSSFPSGCSAGSFCGSYNGSNTCITSDNQAASQTCSSQGGTLSYSAGYGVSCSQPSYSSQATCQAANTNSNGVTYTWQTGWFSNYCVSQ